MYCPNCGAKINVPNQKFCINCGAKLSVVSNLIPTTPVNIVQKSLEKIDQKTPAEIKNSNISHSIKCLVFAIISVGIGFFAYYFGSNVLSYLMMRSMMGSYVQSPFFNYNEQTIKLIFRILIIVVLFLHCFGLFLGILSRKEGKKAKELEYENNVERAGNVFAIIGIVVNAIALVISVIFAFIIFIFM